MSIIDEFEVQDVQGNTTTLSPYAGQVRLIVNVASKCAYTRQYEGLEALYDAHKDRGFTVLAFPCNQFGAQEPGTAPEIQTFCTTAYGVKFPLFGKIKVNGSAAHPLFKYLKSAKPGFLGWQRIRWNFTKFLVDRHGNVVGRFSSRVKPESIEKDIVRLLG